MVELDASLPRCKPAAAGLEPGAVLAFLDDAAANNLELHSLMIVRHGKVAAEGWWKPYAPEIVHGVCSVTKTFTACAAGFAIAEGLFTLRTRVCDLFPEKMPPDPSENLQSMTVHDLLCMGCGQETEPEYDLCENVPAAFLSIPVKHRPGTVFHYNSTCSHLLAEYIFKRTGLGLDEYLEPRLFRPLGISGVRWDSSPQGLPVGGWGLHIKTEDLAKIGLLFLQSGVWNGRQVLPAGWAGLCSQKQIDNSTGSIIDSADWTSGYGYQMWRCRVPGVYRLDGAFGQFSVVLPGQDAVVAITEATVRTDVTLELIYRHLIPGMHGKALTEREEEETQLARRLRGLTLDEDTAGPRSPLERQLDGKTYVFPGNACTLVPSHELGLAFERNRNIRQLALRFHSDACTLRWQEGEREYLVDIGLNGQPRRSAMKLTWLAQPVVSAGRWLNENTLEIIMRAIEELYAIRITLQFEGDGVRLSYLEIVSSHEPRLTKRLTGVCRG